ncbi:ead/Ea22-like family protein [Escherichia coli]|uniref:ead/Ea22-like family protein n=1 Tax=Escherichia coli TaxID=562 RepID=UPI001CEE021B|nr:ead/Ea22-like family protein [Escherichia coli]MCA6195350.1 ead/Ea22-like family protein [Escherichia coli]
MSNIDKQAREKLKAAAAKAVDNFSPHMFVVTGDVLALLDELEAAEKYAKDRDDENKDLMLTVGRLRVEKEAAEKRIAELQARDITIKQHAQALFEAIANPSDHYVPAYARCLREALNGTSTGKGE